MVLTKPAGPVGGDERISESIIRLTDVIRIFREGEIETIALRGLDLEIPTGAYVAVMGRSGSGKSTLLQLLGGSDRPTGGRVVVDGVDLSHADERTRATIRGSRVGVVFQSQNLPDFLTLEEGVILACELAGRPISSREARSVLERVGLGDRATHRPRELSGGEQQRAAVATILATKPRILLADEITGELDSKNAVAVLDLLDAAHAEGDLTIVAATHDPDVAARADRVVELRDGRIVADRPRGMVA